MNRQIIGHLYLKLLFLAGQKVEYTGHFSNKSSMKQNKFVLLNP